MQLQGMDRVGLRDYVTRQLEHFFPDGQAPGPSVDMALDKALQRLQHCIAHVKAWHPDRFDYLHSSQYATFLYFLANSLWQVDPDARVCTKLFLLNKALNGIDLYYEIELPPVFFIGHSVGVVLSKARYGNFLVLYQNTTVGRNHGIYPELGEGVVLYPNSAVIGRCNIGPRSYIGQGVSVINRDLPGHSCVFQAEAGDLLCREPKHDILGDFFRF